MQSRISMLSRRITPLFATLLIFSLLGGCNSDSKGDRGGASEGNAIVLNYDDKSVRATTQVSPVNAMFVEREYHVTIVGGWLSSGDPEKSTGILTTRLILSGESETAVATGSYGLEGGDDLSGPMRAMLVVENAPYGLPKKLAATSGTLKIDSVGVSESGKNPTRSKIDHIELSYDGTFKNDKDDSDTTEYKLTGTIDYTDKK